MYISADITKNYDNNTYIIRLTEPDDTFRIVRKEFTSDEIKDLKKTIIQNSVDRIDVNMPAEIVEEYDSYNLISQHIPIGDYYIDGVRHQFFNFEIIEIFDVE